MFKTRFFTGLATTALLVPQLTLAATPQQMLDQAVRLSVQQPVSQSLMLDVTVDGSFKPSRSLSRRDAESSGARTAASSFQVHLIVEGEMYPHADAMGVDGQGRVRLVKVSSTGEPAVNLSNLGTIEWKAMGDVFYIRIAEISSELRAYAQQTGLEASMLDKAVGTWLKIDPQGLGSFLQQALPAGGNVTVTTRSTNDLEKLAHTLPLFQLVKMEKKVVQGDQTFTRLSVRIHPSLWTRLDQTMVKSIEQDLQSLKQSSPRQYAKERATRVAAMRKSLKESRAAFTKMRLVLLVNDHSGRVERVEGSWQDSMPSYTYVYRGSRSVKVVEGQEAVQVRFAATMQQIEAKVVQEPTPFVTLEALLQNLMSSFMGGSPESGSATGTIVTP